MWGFIIKSPAPIPFASPISPVSQPNVAKPEFSLATWDNAIWKDLKSVCTPAAFALSVAKSTLDTKTINRMPIIEITISNSINVKVFYFLNCFLSVLNSYVSFSYYPP